MKSFESLVNVARFFSLPLSFIDSTKVREVVSGAKDKKDGLLSKVFKMVAFIISIYFSKKRYYLSFSSKK